MDRYIKILMFFLILSVQNIAQTNLLVNHDFEESTDTVSGWWINSWGGASARVFTETDSNVIAGNVSAKVVVDTSSDVIEKVSLMSDPINNVPSGDILITLFARTQTQEYLPFKISLKCENSSGSPKWYGSETVLLTTTPQQFSFVITPAEDYRENIWLRLSCGTNTGTYIFDDVFMGITNADSLPIPTGRRLREIVADKYPDGNVFIGGTTLGSLLGTLSEEILDNEFSYITPANDFKQTGIHPEPGVYNWDVADTWVEKAKENNQVIRMHSPIGPQCSEWAKEDNRTAEELLQNLEEYVTAISQRYNNEENILWMDVVNETIDKNTGEWFGPKTGTDQWENPWTIIGFDTTDDGLNPPLYINRAFELANQYAPNIKQIINQHGTMNDAAWDKVKALVGYLREKGRRVDGIGFQGHVDVGWENGVNDKGVNNIVALENLIDWAHANNLEFHVTENNVFLRNGNEGKWEEQAETYRAIVKTLVSKRNSGVVTWNTWMLRDYFGVSGYDTPSLFEKDGSPKLAYYAVQSVLEDSTTTSISESKEFPVKFVLLNNYPNPFNPTTTISFTLPQKMDVRLSVFNILGEKIETLVNKSLDVGSHSVKFNANNLSSGVYIYRLRAGEFCASKKMLLMK